MRSLSAIPSNIFPSMRRACRCAFRKRAAPFGVRLVFEVRLRPAAFGRPAGAIHHEADAERLPVRQRFDAVDVANAMMADHEGVAVRALLTIELAWLCA